MSFEVLYKGFCCRHLLSINGLRKATLTTYLEEYHDTEHIFLCLDNDEAGRKAAEQITREFSGKVRIETFLPPYGHKDWNEQLVKGHKAV